MKLNQIIFKSCFLVEYVKNTEQHDWLCITGSDAESDEDLDLADEEDIMEMEEGDKDVAAMDKDKLRDEVGRVHL